MSCIRRRCLTVVLVGILLGAVSLPLEAGDIGVTLDGEPLTLPEAPFIQQGRTLVPLRAFWEALGVRVSWDPQTRTARGELGRKVVEVVIDAPAARVDGREVPLEVPAQIVAGRTYIPLRFAGEALNNEVSWDGETRTVHVKSGSPLRTITGTVYDQNRGIPLPGALAARTVRRRFPVAGLTKYPSRSPVKLPSSCASASSPMIRPCTRLLAI